MDLLNETLEKPITEAIRVLASKYKCSEAMLWNDWATQEDWLNEVFEINAVLGKKCVAGLMRVVQEGWRMYRLGDNSNARVGALRVAKEGYSEMLEFLQKIGVFVSPEEDHKEIVLTWGINLKDLNITTSEEEFHEFLQWKKQKEQEEHESSE